MDASYNVEFFTKDEELVLLRYFTNVDKPVFGLINLPEVVKSALYARYSRSNKSLRRLFLDEFYTKDSNVSLDISIHNTNKADKLFERVFVEYGDDSVAQLGGAHLACEQASNILAKVLERGRIAAYLEQSTRYVYYNQKVNDKYNYLIPFEIQQSELREEYNGCVDNLFDTYSEIVDKLLPILREKFPQSDALNNRAWENTLKAKACDIVRGLLPASTRTNIGIFASGQAYELLLLRMFASTNKEVLQYATMMLEELRKIIPSFLKRVDLEDRGKVVSRYLHDINSKMENLNLKATHNNYSSVVNSQVELLDWDKDAIDKVLVSALYENSEVSENDLILYCESLNYEQKRSILEAYVGNRSNRRHKPGRAFERTYYRFDILSDYGAFRDLQRHRMLTIQWQKLSPYNGYAISEELLEFDELQLLFNSAVQKAGALYDKLVLSVGPEIAQYVVPFAYNIRYSLQFNLREAFHLIELRTQKQGHPSYRKVCIDMYNLIEDTAAHGILLKSMKFVDFSFHELSREDSEKRMDQKTI